MADDDLILVLTPREVEVIRQALRLAESNHKRNDFKTLELECAEVRSHINNAILDMQKQNLTRA